MKTRFVTLVAAAACAALLTGAEAKAQGITAVGEIVEACRTDYFRLCPGVRPGGGRILDCLSSYRRELSASCHDALAIAIAIRACRFDYNRFCRHLDPYGGRVAGCLRAHARQLSDACRDVILERGQNDRSAGRHSGDLPDPYEEDK
jgi:hypothetical protein